MGHQLVTIAPAQPRIVVDGGQASYANRSRPISVTPRPAVAVLGSGALPLTVLDELVQERVAATP